MDTKLAAAFVAATAELEAIGKDSVNPHFKNKYASLDAIIANVRPILAAHGLAVSQSGKMSEDGKTLVVETVLIHTSGECFSAWVAVPLAKFDPQGAGGALTYGRRYGLSALLCLATDEDDDGNAASRPAAAKRQPAPKAEDAEPKAEHRAPSKWLGLAGDRPMPFGNTKGKPLGEHSKDHLEKLAKWCATRPDFADFLKDVRRVLADMALGEQTVSETANQTMAKVHASIERDEAPLTALLDGGKPR